MDRESVESRPEPEEQVYHELDSDSGQLSRTLIFPFGESGSSKPLVNKLVEKSDFAPPGFPLRAEMHVHSCAREAKEYGKLFYRLGKANESWLKSVFGIKVKSLREYFNSMNRISYLPLLYDSLQNVKTIAKRAKELELKIVALTDHDSMVGYRELKELNQREGLELIVVPACEISSGEGHILGYGSESKVRQGLSGDETNCRIHEMGGISAGAHPYNLKALGDRIFGLKLDAIEVFNSLASDKSNSRAEQAAAEMGLSGIVGSDAHVKGEIGRSMMFFPGNVRDYHDVIECMKSGEFRCHKENTNLLGMGLRYILGNVRMNLLGNQ